MSFSENKEFLGDLKISGSLSCNGGSYNSVAVSGSGRIYGDVECGDFKVSGSSTVNGNVKSNLFKVSGSSTINGDFEVDEVKISGSLKTKGNAKIGELKVSGSSKFESNLEVDNLNISGSVKIEGGVVGNSVTSYGILRVEKDCECETFNCYGSFIIGGMLNAEVIDIKINGITSVNEIGGKNIKVVNEKFTPSIILDKIASVFNKSYSRLEAKIIEGDDIRLEDTTADIVRGKNIIIGKGCIIKRVEYIENLSVEGNASIEEKIQINNDNTLDIQKY